MRVVDTLMMKAGDNDAQAGLIPIGEPAMPDARALYSWQPYRVTVIIIFLNEKRFLTEAIESVRAQTFECWELLLIDDGSTDGSSEIARRYATAEPGRIRYLEHHVTTPEGWVPLGILVLLTPGVS